MSKITLRLSFPNGLGPNPSIGEPVKINGILWSLHGYRDPRGLELHVEGRSIDPACQFECEAQVTFRSEVDRHFVAVRNAVVDQSNKKSETCLVGNPGWYNVDFLKQFVADVEIKSFRVTNKN